MNAFARKFIALALTLLALAAAHRASATVLVFNNDIGLDLIADSGLNNSGNNYGNRVAASSQSDFEYGSTGGFTPNVAITYGTNPTGSVFHGFINGYGDLDHGVYATSQTSDFIFELTLTADLGTLINFSSFDVAGFGDNNRTANVTVLDEGNAVLFSQPAISIKVLGHDTFNPNVQGDVLKIRLQAVAPNAGNSAIGLDNITFSQVAVPEPTAATLCLSALVLAALRRRRP